MFPLAMRAALMAGSSAWTPTRLFAAGEIGAWYDPSDLTTMFQDSAGTTPVTAVGQAVGLILDKRNGTPVLGDNVVTNGTFDADASWTKGTSWTISGGTANAGGTGSSLTQAVTLNANSWYYVTYTVVSITSGNIKAQLQGGSASIGAVRGSPGTYTELLNAVNNNTLAFVAGGTTPNAVIDNVTLRELPGNHASQSTPTARPTYQSSGGLSWLSFDGTDDFLVTGTINPGSVDKAQVFAGVRKLSDAATGMLVELSATVGSNTGTFDITAPNSTGYGFEVRGSGTSTFYVPTGFASPITNVLTGLFDIGGAARATEVIPRINGTVTQSGAGGASDTGSGNFGSTYPIYIGSRAGAGLRFNGSLYSLIVRFSAANLSDSVISQAETWVNSKTGAY